MYAKVAIKEARHEKNTSNHNYFEYDNDELVAVIYGSKIDNSKKALIKKFLPSSINQYRIHLGGQSGTIKLLPDDYEICYDMREPAFITSVDCLFEDLYN